MDTLSINTVRPALEITRQQAKVNINSKRPVLKIKHSPASMRIVKKAPSFKVKRLNVRSSIGFSPAIQVYDKHLDNTKVAMRAISRIVENGDLNFNLEDNYTPVVEATSPNMNVDSTPVRKDELIWDMGYFRVEWTKHTMEMDWSVERPEISIEPYYIEIKLKNRPGVKIKINKNAAKHVIGLKLDRKV